MSFAQIHGYILGFGVIGSWAVIMFWALALRFTRYRDTPTFWKAVSVAQVLLAVQLLVGIVLLVTGARPGPPGNDGLGTVLFHLSYGLLSPLVVLFVAHKFARDGRVNPHTAFAVVGLVNFGLTFRAFQVGIFGG